MIKIGILTISDRASAGIYEDLSGKAIRETLQSYITDAIDFEYRLIPDEKALISSTLIELADMISCSLIVTTGGTGPSPRDVTPEATEAICEKMMPGFGEQMRAASMQFTPTAILSRQVAGIRGKSLIVNLPGKPKAIKECLDAVFPAIPYCIELMEGTSINTNDEVIRVFRPKTK